MIDSDIKRSFSITSDRMIECKMLIPLEGLINNKEAWASFGEFAKIQGDAESVLERMADFIRKAKHVG